MQTHWWQKLKGKHAGGCWWSRVTLQFDNSMMTQRDTGKLGKHWVATIASLWQEHKCKLRDVAAPNKSRNGITK